MKQHIMTAILLSGLDPGQEKTRRDIFTKKTKASIINHKTRREI